MLTLSIQLHVFICYPGSWKRLHTESLGDCNQNVSHLQLSPTRSTKKECMWRALWGGRDQLWNVSMKEQRHTWSVCSKTPIYWLYTRGGSPCSQGTYSWHEGYGGNQLGIKQISLIRLVGQFVERYCKWLWSYCNVFLIGWAYVNPSIKTVYHMCKTWLKKVHGGWVYRGWLLNKIWKWNTIFTVFI